MRGFYVGGWFSRGDLVDVMLELGVSEKDWFCFEHYADQLLIFEAFSHNISSFREKSRANGGTGYIQSKARNSDLGKDLGLKGLISGGECF